MILLYALAAWYGLAVLNFIYGVSVEVIHRHKINSRARALLKARASASARANQQGRLSDPIGIDLNPSWLYSHDDALLCLSPSMRAEFQISSSTRGRKPLTYQYHPWLDGAGYRSSVLTPSERRDASRRLGTPVVVEGRKLP